MLKPAPVWIVATAATIVIWLWRDLRSERELIAIIEPSSSQATFNLT